MGWPDEDAEDFKRYFPTNTLVTGYDIIFFWVARMIFSGCEHTKQPPFHTVLIHGLVRDEKGRKMSKSLGNGIDPLEIIDSYGCDALRFNLVTGNSPGNDMRFYTERCEAMRNFANKIWNASRFVLMNLTIDKCELPEKLETEDKWILSKLNDVVKEVSDNMDAFELGVAAQKVSDFIWDSYCDWYIELTKPRLNGDDEESRTNAQKVLLYVLAETLKLLHPFMPFITEEIWSAIPHEGGMLISQKYPAYDEKLSYPQDEQDFETLMDAIRSIRSRRAEMNVPPSRKAQLVIVTDKATIFENGRAFLTKLAFAGDITITNEMPADVSGMVSAVTNDAKMFMPMADLVDLDKERDRITKELEKAQKEYDGQVKKLGNEKFLAKAPEKVVAAERERMEKARALVENLTESLKKLG